MATPASRISPRMRSSEVWDKTDGLQRRSRATAGRITARSQRCRHHADAGRSSHAHSLLHEFKNKRNFSRGVASGSGRLRVAGGGVRRQGRAGHRTPAAAMGADWPRSSCPTRPRVAERPWRSDHDASQVRKVIGVPPMLGSGPQDPTSAHARLGFWSRPRCLVKGSSDAVLGQHGAHMGSIPRA